MARFFHKLYKFKKFKIMLLIRSILLSTLAGMVLAFVSKINVEKSLLNDTNQINSYPQNQDSDDDVYESEHLYI